MRKLALLFLALVALTRPALGQHLGDVSITTVSQILFPPNTACTGSPQTAIINNQGQTSHTLLLLYNSGSPNQSVYFLEGSNEGGTFARISDEVDGTNAPTTLQTSGNYTVIRVNLTCTAGSTFGLSYSGAGVPPSTPAGDGLRAVIEKNLINTVPANVGQSGFVRAPYGNLSGLIFASTSGAFSGAATITIQCTYIGGFAPAQVFSLTVNPQQITVPAAPCSRFSWGYAPGTSTGNLSLEYIFSAGFSGSTGTSGSSTVAANVQGVTANGALATSTNPVVDGGIDPNNLAARVGVYPTSVASPSLPGFAIGDPGTSLSSMTNMTTPQSPAGGPLAILNFAQDPSGANTSRPMMIFVPAFGVSQKNIGNMLAVRDSGIQFFGNLGPITTNFTTNLFGVTENTAQLGASTSCDVQIQVSAGTGTTPSLTLFFQDSEDGVVWDDRIAFTAVTTSASSQRAGINGQASNAPHTAVTNTLAAGSAKDGPIGPWMRISGLVTGTTPNWTTANIGVTCH